MVSDVVRGLVARNSLPQEIAADIQLKGNMVLNPHREDWLTVWSALCKETGGLDEGITGRTGDRRLPGPVSLTYAVTQRHRCWHLAVANSILKIKTILASRSSIHRPFEKPYSHFRLRRSRLVVQSNLRPNKPPVSSASESVGVTTALPGSKPSGHGSVSNMSEFKATIY